MRSFVERWSSNRLVLVFMLMVTYSIQSLLVTASKIQGHFEYDVEAVVFLAELLKLCFAISMLPKDAWGSLCPTSSMIFALPGLLYSIQNRLVFVALQHLLPPEYQLLNNMKLFTTSVCYRLVFRRTLTSLQWFGLTLLGVGMTLSTVSPSSSRESSNIFDERLLTGFCVMFVISCCSAGAGVLNEKLIKNSSNAHTANFWLYVYGCSFCSLNIPVHQWSRLSRLEGYTGTVWAIVICNALLGQSVAYLFRYADSIVKLFTTCAAVAFTALLSVPLFGYEVHIWMILGYALSVLAGVLYYTPSQSILKVFNVGKKKAM